MQYKKLQGGQIHVIPLGGL